MEPNSQPWQTGLTNVSKRISYLRSSPKWADLTINFPGHKKSIKAHKLLLAISSPVFEAMMFGPLAEGEVLSLPDDPPEAFEWLLDHLYCDQRNLPNVEIAIEVSKLAHKYQIQELSRICSEYLFQQLNANNLPVVYNIAYMFADNTLLRHCEKILLTNSDKVLESKQVSKLSRSALTHLLENKKLKPSSGLAVFKCIHTWGKAEFGRLVANRSDMEGRLEAAGQSGKEVVMAPLLHTLRQCIESLLPFVDFPSMSVDEFVEHVLLTRIFTPEENMSILQKFKGVSGTVLPSCVRPWTLETILFTNKNSRDYFGICNGSDFLRNIRTSRPIVLHQIEAHFVKYNLEGGTLMCYDGNKVVGMGVYTQTGCIFQKPVKLEPGREFTIKTNKNINYDILIPLDAVSGDIRITGNLAESVKTVLIKHSVLKK